MPPVGEPNAAVHFYELAQRVLLLEDSDPEKTWAGMALRGAKDYKDEVPQQFNEDKEKHARLFLPELA